MSGEPYVMEDDPHLARVRLDARRLHRWTLAQYERMVANRLAGRTPVDREGWPLYYEPWMLDGAEQVAP